MDDGRWTMGNGQWAMGNGQWTISPDPKGRTFLVFIGIRKLLGDPENFHCLLVCKFVNLRFLKTFRSHFSRFNAANHCLLTIANC